MSKSWFTSLFLSAGIIVDQMMKGSLAQITNSEYSEQQAPRFFLSLKLTEHSLLDSVPLLSNLVISILYFLCIVWVGKLYVTAFRKNQMGPLVGMVILLTGLLCNFFDRSVAGHAFSCFLLKMNLIYLSFSIADIYIPVGIVTYIYFTYFKRVKS